MSARRLAWVLVAVVALCSSACATRTRTSVNDEVTVRDDAGDESESR